MARQSVLRRSRPPALVACVALAALLAAAPPSPLLDAATARAPRLTLATESTRMAVVGRGSLRVLARAGGSAGSRDVVTHERLAWDRGGPAGAEISGGAESTSTMPSAVTAGIEPATIEPATIEPAAAGGPGVVGTAWNGLTDQAIACGNARPCLEPPDPWVAVSATHVMQMVNPSTRITSRTGGGAVQLSNRAFFGVDSWSTNAFVADPRVLFDPAHGRWVATVFAGTCSAGAIFVAVSDTADPTGTWSRFYRPFAGRWPDFPTLGFSSTLVVVGVNEFGVSCGSGGSVVVGGYAGASLHVMDWADLLDGGGAPTIASTAAATSAFTYVPAAGLTAGDALHVVVALDDGSSDRADLGYLGIAGSVIGGTLEVGAPVNLTSLPLAKLQDPPAPRDAAGLIGVQRNALDLRPTDAVWRSGRLAVASTTSCVVSSSARPCGRVTELLTQGDLSTPSVRQDLRIGPTSGYSDTFMPGVGYSDDGTLWTVFSQSSSGRYVSSWARRQVPGATAGSWSAGSALVASGRGPYGGTAGAGLNQRWGDYVGVARDPAEPGSVWQANQMPDTGGGWATRVARLGDDTTPPTVGTPWPFFVAGSRASSTSVPVRISWSQADGGSGVARAHLERSIDGGPFTAITLPSTSSREVTLNLAYGTRYTFRVAATDNGGTMSGWTVGPSFTPTVYSEGSSSVSYAGAWTASRSSSYLGGAARYTTVARRRATLSFTGYAVAWVSTAAKTRGSARVSLDGTLLGTYSTYRSTAMYRRVITGRTFTTSGAHAIRVEVAGTSGRPRVDLDAFIVLR